MYGNPIKSHLRLCLMGDNMGFWKDLEKLTWMQMIGMWFKVICTVCIAYLGLLVIVGIVAVMLSVVFGLIIASAATAALA